LEIDLLLILEREKMNRFKNPVLVGVAILILAIFVGGFSKAMQVDNSQLLQCLYPSNATCHNITTTNCNTVCRKIFLNGPEDELGVSYQCRPPQQQEAKPDVVLTSFSVVVASDYGYCKPDYDPDPVFCATVYFCDEGCDRDKEGQPCTRGLGVPFGPLVQPRVVDWETGMCPSVYCDQMREESSGAEHSGDLP
jgi:hypothetical protein